MARLTREQFKKRKEIIEKLVVFPSTDTTPAEFRFHGKQYLIITEGKIKTKKMVRLIACWYFIKYRDAEMLDADEKECIKINIEDMMLDNFKTLIIYTPKKKHTLMRILDTEFLLDNVLDNRLEKFDDMPFCITLQNNNENFELHGYSLKVNNLKK